MNIIYATYNIHHNSIDIYTHAGYFLHPACKFREGIFCNVVQNVKLALSGII